MRCRRSEIDEPVSQGEVHRYIADTIYKAKKEEKIIAGLIKEKLKKTGKKISIIGAGPSGLTSAYYLVRLGHDVTIYDAAKKAGGILQYGIPQYRLPKDILDREIAFVKKLGAKFILNKKIDAEMLRTIEKDSDSVFVATGAYKNMALGIQGEDLSGVMSGTVFLEDVATKKKVTIGSDVLVIGAGNVAIDAARSALRLGSKVTVVYRRDRDDMPANADEIVAAEEEGIKFVFFAAPKEIIGDNDGRVKALLVSKMVPGEYDVSGRKRPVQTDETYEMPCDTVMRAIGERVDSKFLNDAGLMINKDGTIHVEALSLRTTNKKIYAGGDVVTGPSTAVKAMADGKKAARAIDLTLMGKDRFGELYKKYEYADKIPEKQSKKGRQKGSSLPVKVRIKNFEEVSRGLNKQQALIETDRCLRCDVKE